MRQQLKYKSRYGLHGQISKKHKALDATVITCGDRPKGESLSYLYKIHGLYLAQAIDRQTDQTDPS
jgi:hypothetical protein